MISADGYIVTNNHVVTGGPRGERPAVVVVDSAIGRIDARQVAEASRGLGAKTVVIGDHVDGFDASGDSADAVPSLVRSVLTMDPLRTGS